VPHSKGVWVRQVPRLDRSDCFSSDPNGRLSVVYGSNPDLPGQPGSGNQFLNIHGN